MQGVPLTAQAALTRRFLAMALVACALALGACGGDDEPAERKRPKGLPADFNIQVFNCSDWNAAGPEVREYVLARLHSIANDQITGPGVQGRGSVLTDEQATKMFDSTCANPRARGFVLYKLYAFSRGFRGRGPEGS